MPLVDLTAVGVQGIELCPIDIRPLGVAPVGGNPGVVACPLRTPLGDRRGDQNFDSLDPGADGLVRTAMDLEGAGAPQCFRS